MARSGRQATLASLWHQLEGLLGNPAWDGGQVNPGIKMSEAEAVARLGDAGKALFRLGEEATDVGSLCGFETTGVGHG